ncbi:VpaChn25_0724 family phage protein [Thiomicrorhabdus cannonii]|uniref:VpaChn25_0724 family phage protein n=1 Tax=Thiomicrorhabdus cannonii TaxID=2748011 RepID=UPI0015B9F103|nr:ArsR family transcriptional regulator [Thiomicrorhabdus cannonii]
MNFKDHVIEHCRRLMLEQLEQENDYAQNHLMIKQSLFMAGQTLSFDKVLAELHWLQEQGLVTLDSFGGFTVAKLTHRGLDVATGASQMPGIARKSL